MANSKTSAGGDNGNVAMAAGAPAGLASVYSRMPSVTIEACAKRMGRVLHPLTQRLMRSRFRKSELLPDEITSGVGEGESFAGAPLWNLPDNIPGLRLTIDFQRRAVRTYDPLGEPEFAHLLQAINRIKMGGEINQLALAAGAPLVVKGAFGPAPESLETDLSDTGLKSHTFHAWRLVHGGSAIVVAGQLPDLDTIKSLPGKTRISTIYQGDGARYREDMREEDRDFRPLGSVQPSSQY